METQGCLGFLRNNGYCRQKTAKFIFKILDEELFVITFNVIARAGQAETQVLVVLIKIRMGG